MFSEAEPMEDLLFNVFGRCRGQKNLELSILGLFRLLL